jgi:predicted deacetylase
MDEPTLFLRDDDVGPRNAAIERFVEIFLSRLIPVSYQIIPARLTADSADWLAALAARHPGLIEFGQHGHTHEMTVRGRRQWYEFGPERDRAEQRSVIAAGRARLAELLGAAWAGRLFTPPRHRYDRNTLRALADEGFGILSASFYPGLAHQLAYRAGVALGRTNWGRGGVSHHGSIRPEAPLLELSIAVAVDHGAPVERRVDDVLAEIDRARRASPIVGLMFHHQAWARPGGADFLEALADRLATLPGARVATIGAIADGIQSARR